MCCGFCFQLGMTGTLFGSACNRVYVSVLYSYITKDILVQKWKMIDIIVGVFASSNVCIYIYIYIYILYIVPVCINLLFSACYIS